MDEEKEDVGDMDDEEMDEENMDEEDKRKIVDVEEMMKLWMNHHHLEALVCLEGFH